MPIFLIKGSRQIVAVEQAVVTIQADTENEAVVKASHMLNGGDADWEETRAGEAECADIVSVEILADGTEDVGDN